MSDVEVLSRTQTIRATTPRNIEVLSRTQRIIVELNKSVTVIPSGPIGPPGPTPAPVITYATGEQTTPLQIFIIDHNLGFYPAGIRFYTLDDVDELEPEDIVYVDENRILAIWPEPTVAKWFIS